MRARLSAVSRPWYFGPLIGAVLGFVLLGVGGRLAMRGVALLTGASPGFSIGGTFTVIFLGVVAGVAGGAIRGVTGIGDRLPPWARLSLFGVACLLLTLRGLRPLDAMRLWLFLPLVAAYVVLVELAWQRLRRWRSLDAPIASPGGVEDTAPGAAA